MSLLSTVWKPSHGWPQADQPPGGLIGNAQFISSPHCFRRRSSPEEVAKFPVKPSTIKRARTEWSKPRAALLNWMALAVARTNYLGAMWAISSIWKRDFHGVLGLWLGPLENIANIFYLKMGFPSFFGSCNRNLSRKMSISSVWKRYFRGSGLVTVTFGKQCQYLVFENGMSVVFWACDGNLWKILPISSIWKWNFRVFLGFWWEPLENNANIFYLKTGFPFFGLVMGTSGK